VGWLDEVNGKEGMELYVEDKLKPERVHEKEEK